MIDAPKVEVVRIPESVLRPGEWIAIDTETTGESVKLGYTPMLDRVILASISDGKRRQIIPVELVCQALGPILKDPSIIKVFHNAKYDMHVLCNLGLKIEGPVVDTMVLGWLVDTNDITASLDSLAEKYLGAGKRSFGKIFDAKKNPFLSDLELSFEYASYDAWITALLFQELRSILVERNWPLRPGKSMWDYYLEFEAPFTKVLFNMERRGVRIDMDYVDDVERKIKTRLSEIESEVNLAARKPVNLNSPAQLSDLLFNHLGCRPKKLTATGAYSTDVSVLEELAAEGVSVAKLVLEYRALSTLNKTFVQGIKKRVPLTGGRLYPTFNQSGTRTGRLSGSSPNTQNFPRPDNDPFQIRKAFLASDGHLLIDSDYSQAEVRLIAHLCGDARLVESILTSDDVYTAIAKDIFGIPKEDVTKKIRNIVKRLVLAVNYGMAPSTLAEDLTKGGIPTTPSEAEQLLGRYFSTYPLLRDYIDRIPYVVKENKGYFYTLLGRTRFIPELLSSSNRTFSLGKRQAVNTGPQGGVADLLRVAMIQIETDEDLKQMGNKMLLQIHDELLFECPEQHVDEAMKRISSIMKDCLETVGIKLAAPMVVEIRSGKNWAEAKE